PKSFKELGEDVFPADALAFADIQPYQTRLHAAQKKTGLSDACVTGEVLIEAHPLVIAILDFEFMGGSMGSVVGEKITLAIERAIKRRLPLLVISSSGGARMQE